MGTALNSLLPSFLEELGPMTKVGAPVTPAVIGEAVKKFTVHPLSALGNRVRNIVRAQISGPGGLQELGRRLERGPAYTMAEGWRDVGRHSRLRPGPVDEKFRETLGRRYGWQGPLPPTMSKAEQIAHESAVAQAAGKPMPWYASGSHLAEHAALPVPVSAILKGQAEGKGRVRALAEELSRRGWTGEGRATKYLPLGPKGLMVGTTAGLDVPYILSEDPGPEGEGRVGKLMSSAGGLAGMVAGGGLGFLPMLATWYGGSKAGEMLGRGLERMGKPKPSILPAMADPNLFSGSEP